MIFGITDAQWAVVCIVGTLIVLAVWGLWALCKDLFSGDDDE